MRCPKCGREHGWIVTVPYICAECFDSMLHEHLQKTETEEGE